MEAYILLAIFLAILAGGAYIFGRGAAIAAARRRMPTRQTVPMVADERVPVMEYTTQIPGWFPHTWHGGFHTRPRAYPPPPQRHSGPSPRGLPPAPPY